MCMGCHPWKSWVCVESEGKVNCWLKRDLIKLFLMAGMCPGQLRCSQHRAQKQPNVFRKCWTSGKQTAVPCTTVDAQHPLKHCSEMLCICPHVLHNTERVTAVSVSHALASCFLPTAISDTLCNRPEEVNCTRSGHLIQLL